MKNHSSSSCALTSTIKMDIIKESGAAQKTLYDLRKFNEGIRGERQQHALLYYKRITKYTQRQMRGLIQNNKNNDNKLTESTLEVNNPMPEQELSKTIAKMKELCTHRFIVMKKRRQIETTDP